MNENKEIIINEKILKYEVEEYDKMLQELNVVIHHLFRFNNDTYLVHKDELLPIVERIQECTLLIDRYKNDIKNKRI